jgi:DNA-binding winged helix-turn-helix (wHTH) protein
VSESALTARIKQARHAVDDDGRAQRVIKTVHGRGYRLVAPVDELVPAPAPAGAGERDPPLEPVPPTTMSPTIDENYQAA